MAAFYIRSRIKHFLHTRTTLRSFVCDHHHIARDDFSTEDAFASRILRIEHFRRTGKLPDAFIHTGRLDHTTVQRDISFQDSQAAIFGISMLDITDTSGGTIGIQFLIIGFLRSHPNAETMGGSTLVFLDSLVRHIRRGDSKFIHGFGKRHSVHTLHIPVYQAVFQQLVHDSHDTTGTVHILDVVGMRVGSNLAEARSLAGEHIDIVHREARLSFLRDGEQVENRIGGTTHCNIQ